MGAGCLIYNFLVSVSQSIDLSVAQTGVQHREISEGMGHLWVPSTHNVSNGRMEP